MNDFTDLGQQCSQLLKEAVAHHHAGRLSQAEQLYKILLKINLLHADANHNLGILAMQAGQTDAALHHLELALLTNRKSLQYAMTYARALLECGDTEAAAELVAGSMLNTSPLPEVKTLRQQLASTVTKRDEAAPSLKLTRSKKHTNHRINDTLFRRLQVRRMHAFKQAYALAELEQVASYLTTQDPNSTTAWMALAYTLLELGKPAMRASQEAVKLNPENAEAIGFLGQAFARQEQWQEAGSHFQRALAIAPDDPHLHYHAGNLHSTLGQWIEAETHFRLTIAHQPNHAKAHCNLGKCLQLQQRFHEAIEHYQLALRADPHLSSAQHNLGLIFKATGQFDAALHSLRTAIHSQLDIFRRQGNAIRMTSQVQRNKRPLHPPQAHLVLDLLQQQLAQLKVAFCLFAGCALGVFREGDLLAFDKDLDIAIDASVDRQWLLNNLLRSGEFRVSLQYHTKEEREHRYSVTLLHTASQITVDIFFLHPDGRDHFLVGAFHPAQALLCRLSRFDFAPHLWRGTLWNLPSNTEHYLAQIYGENWRVPDRGYDTVLSNPSRIAAAMPPVLCYAYSRLCLFLQERDWVNCASICRQILARTSDDLLLELQTWLSSIQESQVTNS